MSAGPSGRAVSGVGLQPLTDWDCGLESHRGHGCLSVVSVVYLSGRGLCDELIPRPEESYLLWCVVVCDLETSWMRRPWPTGGCCVKKNHVCLLSLLITSISEMFRTITGVRIASIISEISFATRRCGLSSGVRYFVFKCYPSCCSWWVGGHNDFYSEMCYVKRTTLKENIRRNLEAALN